MVTKYEYQSKKKITQLFYVFIVLLKYQFGNKVFRKHRKN